MSQRGGGTVEVLVSGGPGTTRPDRYSMLPPFARRASVDRYAAGAWVGHFRTWTQRPFTAIRRPDRLAGDPAATRELMHRETYAYCDTQCIT